MFARFQRSCIAEIAILMMVCFVFAGDLPPSVNEAHYLVKAKNFWQPDWCGQDLFAASRKAHVVFYALMGWPTLFCSLETTAWGGRIAGWLMVAAGLRQVCLAVAEDLRYRHHWAISAVVAMVWLAAMHHGNLAGEWVIGGIEGKVPAYGCLLMGLASCLRRKWNSVWVWLGIASSFHVLTGGWAVIAAGVVWWVTEGFKTAVAPDETRSPLVTRWLVLGGLLALPGIVPAVMLTAGTPTDVSLEAAKVYVYGRIRHHLLPSALQWWWYVRYTMVLMVMIWLAWPMRRCVGGGRGSGVHRLIVFTLTTVLIAVAGLLIGLLPPIAPELAVRLLRYYWFRLSDAVVPLALAVLAVVAIQTNRSVWTGWLEIVWTHGMKRAWKQTWTERDGVERVSLGVVAAGLLLFGWTAIGRIGQSLPPSVQPAVLGRTAFSDAANDRRVLGDWKAVCRWAKDSTQPDEVFITPRHQQTFKWYAQRAEVVNWKDVPQDAASLTRWQQRFDDLYPEAFNRIRVSINYQTLRRFRQQYRVRYLIVDRRVVGENLPLIRLYPSVSEDNPNYAVYELPQ